MAYVALPTLSLLDHSTDLFRQIPMMRYLAMDHQKDHQKDKQERDLLDGFRREEVVCLRVPLSMHILGPT